MNSTEFYADANDFAFVVEPKFGSLFFKTSRF